MTKEEMREAAFATVAQFVPVPLKTIGWYEQAAQAGINKAGVVPFIGKERGKMQFFLMKPAESGSYNTPSKFQICKGTREVLQDGVWEDYQPKKGQDYLKENLEPMLVTALREGIEEIGLRMDNILKIYEWGRAEFRSEKTHQPKSLWLYLTEVRDKEAFDLPDTQHANTGERRWISLPRDKDLVREDHLKILMAVLEKYQGHQE